MRPICGRPPKLSAEQQADLLAWHSSRKTLREKARELRISVETARQYINGMHKRPVRA